MDVLDRFAVEYQAVHDISPDRRTQQLGELRKFAAFAGKPIEQCDAGDFSRYMGHLSTQNLHVNTVTKRVKMIRPFFRFGFNIGIISADTYMRVREVPNPKKASNMGKPRPYTRKEMQQLWRDLHEKFPEVDERFWKRWKKGTSRYKRVAPHVFRIQMTAIIRLALDCGLRREEIFNLTLEDAHPDNAGVAVRKGKGGESRQVPYTDEARAAVREWIEVRRLMKPKHQKMWLSVLPNQPGGEKMVSREASFHSFEFFVRCVGPYHLHRLRHTCATNWLRAEMPLHIVQRLLGHKNIQQTLVYAQLLDADIQAAVERNQYRFEEDSGREAA